MRPLFVNFTIFALGDRTESEIKYSTIFIVGNNINNTKVIIGKQNKINT